MILFFYGKHCISEYKYEQSFVDMLHSIQLDIFALGKFDMFSLRSNSI